MAESATEPPASTNDAQSGNASPQTSKEGAKRPLPVRKPPPVGLIGTMLIVATLLAVGVTDLFRWLLVALSMR